MSAPLSIVKNKDTSKLKRNDKNILPYNDISLLMNFEKLREEVTSAKPKNRQRLVAFLTTIYPATKLADMLGIKKSYVAFCCLHNRDIIEAGQLGRNVGIADLAERRVIQILQKIDPEKMHPDKQAQSARNLMEVAEMAMTQVRPREKEEEGDTMSLVFKLTKRMEANKPKEIEQDELIDITDQVTVTDIKDAK